MEVETEAEAPLPELAAVLEHATLMAKQLPSAADPSQLLQIHAALHAAHHRLSLFLSPQPENSVSSAAAGEPMQMEDEDEEQNSRAAVEKVAWRMKECFIQNKRPKRHLSPSAEQQRRRSFEDEADAAPEVFDPLITKLRALELIHQFHA
ncbi:hypothetical protein SASPL_109077 [Salvia splendens]|uniref:Uncharacterized protein n=1 Tax=Salvia splendens TaxID=180675 RepID=A0A8X8YHW3_SALSN|nr:uncharacterized protein LOC121793474 [Salvia splendens]KAG6431002.1 hypothetical protein SASPL_109077 [Salvia splendens]